MANKANYPFLSISKLILRIIGVIAVLSTLIGAIALARSEFILGIFDLCCCDGTAGVTVLGFFVGLIGGAVSGFIWFALAEVIALFVTMGQNVEKLAQNVKSLAEREEE
ncbi:MAG: hypothetical protein LBC82_01145 [Oscillospiraceae bacterium]|jgi:hypothetical protein|nr:hypothetical protein [Oscillospiraceae bacterium]